MTALCEASTPQSITFKLVSLAFTELWSTPLASRLRVRKWDRLSNAAWPTLLIGNGASINVWSDFGYSELLRQARLSGPAAQLFGDLGTVNFESVLEGLWHAERVLAALGRGHKAVTSLYEEVRSELVATVGRVHVPWDRVDGATLTRFADVMHGHDLVFTLNYDLLTYWSLMENTANTAIADFFWADGSTFDPASAKLFPGWTGLLYLHGGVHLWQDTATGQSGKWTSTASGNLLSGLHRRLSGEPSRQPLFVSEGTSAQKLRVIRRSDYLSFARQKLIDDLSDTVIFGASFGPQDTHIVDALRTGGRRKIAISIRPGPDDQQVEAMARYQERFPDQDVSFFDSTTHPLGDPALAAARLPRIILRRHTQ